MADDIKISLRVLHPYINDNPYCMTLTPNALLTSKPDASPYSGKSILPFRAIT
jgi:hypothetical protein